MLFRIQNKPCLEFLCAPEDRGVIAEPMLAKANLPDWFRKLPAVDGGVQSATNNGLTIKRCMPFLDAMMTGWLLTLGATVRLDISNEGRQVDAGWEFDKTMVSNHGAYQIAGHPQAPRPPMKFHNYWTIKTPPGWSCLFVQPMNRHGLPVEIISGVVDTDTYASLINFPFIATGGDGLHIIEKGTPIVQVIPFRRDDATIEAKIGVETSEEANERQRILRSTMAGEGWYRKEARARR
ncbi:MAG: DUF6065 family protein [Beijerinckiaceae bacterium]